MTTLSNDIENVREQLHRIFGVAEDFDSSLMDLSALKHLVCQLADHYTGESADSGHAFQAVLSYLHWFQGDYEDHMRALYEALGNKAAADAVSGGAS